MKKFITLLISLLYIDFAFILIGFGHINIGTIFRVLLANATLSLLMCFINNKKAFKIACIVFLSILSVYAFIQLEFKNFMATFYSFKAIQRGIEGVKGYVWYFIAGAKWTYYLTVLSIPIYLLLDKFLIINEEEILKKILKAKYKDDKSTYRKKLRKYKGSFTLTQKILICTNLIAITILMPFVSKENDLVLAYKYNDNYDYLLNNIGTNHFIFKDLYSSIFPKKLDFTFEKEVVIINNSNTEEEDIEDELVIDDTEWNSLKESETNKSIKNIDEYLMSRPTTHQTKHTGEFEDYNFIYFLVESFDYIAIDETLTPTLYKMWNEGYHFTDHYSPVYACCTGDSEFVGMTGLYPLRSVCTAYEVLDTNLETSLAGLFKESGYSVQAFHNWDDQFYTRSKLEYAYGVDSYKDVNGLKMKRVSGWQSDKDLIEYALPEFINEDKFFTFFITSSMHWPYDSSSYLGDKYLKEINEVYPDYPIEVKRYISKCMEFDRGLELLLNSLDEAGKLKNTVISVFADHRPLKFEASTLFRYRQLTDKTDSHDNNLTPFLIYNSRTKGKEISTPCSTIDHVPTIANLFNLNYDPRFYMGDDALEGNCLVIFNSLDWITNEGLCVRSQGVPEGMTQEYVDAINSKIKNLTNTSIAMLDYNYIEKRKSIIYPKYK